MPVVQPQSDSSVSPSQSSSTPLPPHLVLAGVHQRVVVVAVGAEEAARAVGVVVAVHAAAAPVRAADDDVVRVRRARHVRGVPAGRPGRRAAVAGGGGEDDEDRETVRMERMVGGSYTSPDEEGSPPGSVGRRSRRLEARQDRAELNEPELPTVDR
jgi:hypothetical protein